MKADIAGRVLLEALGITISTPRKSALSRILFNSAGLLHVVEKFSQVSRAPGTFLRLRCQLSLSGSYQQAHVSQEGRSSIASAFPGLTQRHFDTALKYIARKKLRRNLL
jgi:hypothetical protein